MGGAKQSTQPKVKVTNEGWARSIITQCMSLFSGSAQHSTLRACECPGPCGSDSNRTFSGQLLLSGRE